ncbi:MAG: efflux RND transporter periplasmic adaptor subunit [Chloroflexota bacterium]|nr:efflux RND transporter periplasmic adaptor subunit [Chloroflexota bacterium]
MRRFFIIFIILIVLGVGGWVGYQQYWLPRQAAAQQPTYEIFGVRRDTIASTVSATGNIEPESEVSLSFRSPGRVGNVLVTAGQTVTQGQLIATLETTELTLALAQSKVSLQISQAQLDKLEAPPTAKDLAVAQAAVEVAQSSIAGAEATLNSAQASYRQLFASNSAEQGVVNLAQVRQAEANVKQAQQAYNQVKSQPNIGELPQSAQLEQATVALEVARAQASLTDQGPDQAQVAGALNQIAQAEVGVRQAQSNLIQAQNNLQTLLDGPDKQDLEIARAQVRQAQLSELQTENSLANAQLLAPLDGVVSAVNIRQGEVNSGAAPAVVLTDLRRFHMTVLVDEIDVRQVQVGQPVRLSLDALPDTEITGQVTEISPTANDVNGVIAYEVTIVPDATDAPLRAGMSATAIITTAQVDDVVLLPNRFIQLDRETEQAFVYKMVNNEPALQAIELGLRNETDSQILAGLTDGDNVALVTETGAERLRGALFGGG